MRKLHLILLSLVAAVPGGVLCFLLGTALSTERTDLWKNGVTSPLGLTVVLTGLAVLGAAVVFPLLYAAVFYDDPNKGRKSEADEAGEEGAADGDGEPSKTPRSESFEEEDIDAFEREGITPDADEAEEYVEGSEFDVEEESIDTAETADFDLGDDEFADLDVGDEDEEEEEAPKKKAKPSKAKKKKK